jgi:hypothetical protein
MGQPAVDVEVGWHHDGVEPNLQRVPGDRDWMVQAILTRARGSIDQEFLNGLDEEAWLSLGRYGIRQVTSALREGSVDLLRQALLATGLAACPRSDDERDTMVGLALPWVVAQQLEIPAAEVFADVADRLPDAAVAGLLREFGSRSDVTLQAFGWETVTTSDGPDFRPLY